MDLPISFDKRPLDEFLDFLDVDTEIRGLVPAMMAEPQRFYRQFSIPKRSGGHRTVRSPFPSLAQIQRSLLRQVLRSQVVSEHAFAYLPGKNAIGHAAFHLKNDQLLTLDIADFFHSVTRQMVYQIFSDAGLSSKFSQYAALLCCYGNCLPQGACTSPTLSNLAFGRLDHRLYRLASALHLNYSRYADDLAFSGQVVPIRLIKTVEKILFSQGFQLNMSKIRLKKAGAKKILTGVSIASGKLKAPKSFKRALRSQIYELERNFNNLSSMAKIDPFAFERVIGRINYLLQIEPDNHYAHAKKESLSQAHQNFLSLVPSDLLAIFSNSSSENALIKSDIELINFNV